MLNVEKKRERDKRPKWPVLVVCGLLLALSMAIFFTSRPDPSPGVLYREMTNGELTSYQPEDVMEVQVSRRERDAWRLERDADQVMRVSGTVSMPADETQGNLILNAMAVLTWEQILTDQPEEWVSQKEIFGLKDPLLEVQVTYRDGLTVNFQVGDQAALEDETYYYMAVTGDDRLFALDRGTVDLLNVEAGLLCSRTETDLHKARIDRIRVRTGAGETVACWELKGEITDNDAADNWYVTVPWKYPADGEWMTVLRGNLEAMTLGNLVGEATPELLKQYGLEQPDRILEVHEAAGDIGTVNEAGQFEVTSWPEKTFTMAIAAPTDEEDLTRAVLAENRVYLMSTFILQAIIGNQPMDSVSRYPVTEPLSELSEVRVTRDGVTDCYVLDVSAEQDEDGNERLDENGNAVWQVCCTKNGQEIDGNAFSAAWDRLLVVTVSGVLPDGWQPEETAHTTLEILTRGGKRRTVRLFTFDKLHDAVIVDDSQLFYLAKNGLTDLP